MEAESAIPGNFVIVGGVLGSILSLAVGVKPVKWGAFWFCAALALLFWGSNGIALTGELAAVDDSPGTWLMFTVCCATTLEIADLAEVGDA
jgi:hypothetical protein